MSEEKDKKQQRQEEFSETENERLETDSVTGTNGAPSKFNAKKPAVIVTVTLLALLAIIYFAWWRAAKPAETAATETEKKEAGKVKFLMEQQWLIKMKLAEAEQQSVSRQLTSTGRVVPAAN